jgi:hypothetical protein
LCEVIFAKLTMPRGQPENEFVPDCTRFASSCTSPPQFASSCMKLHPQRKFVYVRCN